MKKLGLTSIVLVIVVVAIVALLYLAYIGMATSVPQIGAKNDPTGRSRSPIGYAVFSVQCQVRIDSNFVSGWSGFIKSIDIKTYPWVNGTSTINQMYNQKMDPLGLFSSSNFEGWVALRITGPGNYIFPTQDMSKQQVKVGPGLTASTGILFGPYSAKFYDAGQYSLSATFYRMNGDTPMQMGQMTQTFTISGI